MSIINGLSIDLEEYFHAENVKRFFPTNPPSRVQESTLRILNLLESKNIKATFFVLGQVAKNHPELIKAIYSSGHEIASHGFNHELVYNQSPEDFRNDITTSKKLLEDLTGAQILGYRAPSFSITEKTPWALKIIAESEFKYDSSIYPIHHPRYANTNKPRFPYLHQELGLIEVPLATTVLKILRKTINLPIAGGAYWRLLPLCYATWGLKRLTQDEEQIAFTYFHPWELDPAQPRGHGMSTATKIRHYFGQDKFLEKLEYLFARFRFDKYRTILKL